MVEVFKTNITKKGLPEIFTGWRKYCPGAYFSFDLEDRDRILRAVMTEKTPDTMAIAALITNMGFNCEVLND